MTFLQGAKTKLTKTCTSLFDTYTYNKKTYGSYLPDNPSAGRVTVSTPYTCKGYTYDFTESYQDQLLAEKGTTGFAVLVNSLSVTPEVSSTVTIDNIERNVTMIVTDSSNSVWYMSLK